MLAYLFPVMASLGLYPVNLLDLTCSFRGKHDACFLNFPRTVHGLTLGSLSDTYVVYPFSKRRSRHKVLSFGPGPFLCSADGVVCVGVEIRGRDLTLGVSPSKLRLLGEVTTGLLAKGFCTGSDMERLIGHWTWAFMPRRAAFSVFSAVYRFVEAAGGKTFEIWPSVAKELSVAVGLSPLLFASLDASWMPDTVATDASMWGMGMMAAPVGPEVCREMAVAPPPVGPVDRRLHPGLQGRRWRQIVSSPWRFQEHINVLELRALFTAVKWAVSSPRSAGGRLLSWVDSLVVLFSVRKGRSSSHPLLRRLRSMAAFLLAVDLALYCNYIPTEVNPADRPSRRYRFDSTPGFPGEGPRDFLHRAAHRPATRKKYDSAFAAFAAWVSDAGLDPRTPRDFDVALGEYFHDLYEEGAGRGRGKAEATLCGLLVFLPQLKGQLHGASLALRGWKNLVPSVPWPPLSWDLAVLIATTFVCRGAWSTGVAVLLAFECYLRVGVLSRLTRGDVATSSDDRLGSVFSGMALRLLNTKTGNYQWVTVRSTLVQGLLRLLLQGIGEQPQSPLFSFSAFSFRKGFKETVLSLGLTDRYVPHSLRHGGATHDHIRGISLEEIVRHGRWASMRSAKHYIQRGRALLLETTTPAEVLVMARTVAADPLLAFLRFRSST